MDFDDALRIARQISADTCQEFPLHAFSGAIAQCHWSGTGVVDELEILIPCRFGEEAHVARHLHPASEDDAKRFRQILIQHQAGIRVRYVLCGLPFEETVLARAIRVQGLPVLSAEDWLLLMLFRFRAGVESDVRALLSAQRGFLQWPYIEHWLPQLAELKEDHRPLELLDTLRAASLAAFEATHRR